MSRGQRFTDDFKKSIVGLYESGKHVSVLSKEYGISLPTIYKVINKSRTIRSFKTNDN
jgi:transposase